MRSDPFALACWQAAVLEGMRPAAATRLAATVAVAIKTCHRPGIVALLSSYDAAEDDPEYAANASTTPMPDLLQTKP